MQSKMHRRVLAAVVCVLSPAATTALASDYGKVIQVTGAAAVKIPSARPTLLIAAVGLVPDAGWHNARLIPYVYVVPPKDGIWDFDFVAEPGEGPSVQVITPIHAFEVIANAPDWVKGVRIHAAGNEVEVSLANDLRAFQAFGREDEAPSKISQNGVELTDASLELRVRHEQEGDKHCAVVEAVIELGSVDTTIEVGRFCIEAAARCVEIDEEVSGIEFEGEACIEGDRICVRLKACKDFGFPIGELCTPEVEACVGIN